MPETSIVIRTFNEGAHLPALFDGLDRQTYRDFETVVVDSGSFDLTCDIANKRADRLARIHSSDFTFGYSLNRGIEHSAGRFIVIVSAHTKPVTNDWLARLVAPLRDTATAMVYGRQCGVPESKFSEYTDFERTFGPISHVLTPPSFFANNANSAVARDLWERHAFDETLPGLEDIEWAKYWMQNGYRVVYVAEAPIFHIHDETWMQVRRRYYREGQAARWIGVRSRRDIPAEVLREMRYALDDLGRSGLRTGAARRWYEIGRFRYEKLRGTVSGIYDGALMENPMARETLFFDRSYRAAVIHGSGRASLDHRELPALKPSDVLVHVAFQGVCMTDIEIFDGSLGYYKNGLAKYPIVPGHEFAGVVADVGSRVTALRHGDRVVVECIQGCGDCASCKRGNMIGCSERREVGVIGRDGGYAEYMITPAQFVHRVPSDLGTKEACLCEPLAVVLKGLRRLDAVLGESNTRSYAVIGGGPIGHLAARVLALRGHRVTVFDRNASRLWLFNASDIETREAMENLDTFDAVVEATGDPDVADRVVRESAAGAAILFLGLPYGSRPFTFESIVGFDKTVVGSVGSTAQDFKDALATLPLIDTSAFLQRVMPLSQFREAWNMARAGEFLKVVLSCGDSESTATGQRAAATADQGRREHQALK